MKSVISLSSCILFFIFIFLSTIVTGQVSSRRTISILKADSLNKTFTRANHALREIGFKVTQTNRRKTRVLLERQVGSWFYQTVISHKYNKVNIEIFFFTGPTFKLSWTYPERQMNNVDTIFNVIDFRLRNGEPIPPLLLANSILWGIEIDYNPPEAEIN